MDFFKKKFSFTFKYFSIFLLLFIFLFFFLIEALINLEDDCIQYAKFIESDYKFDSTYGCYVNRNNIWISKSESQFK